MTFCSIFSVDHLCGGGSRNSWSCRQTEDIVGDYVSIQCGILNLLPDTIRKVYLPGIASIFDSNRIENKFRETINSKEIKLLYNGFQRVYCNNNPKAGTMKIPFDMDLAIKSRIIMTQHNLPEKGNNRQLQMKLVSRERIFVAEAVGINSCCESRNILDHHVVPHAPCSEAV